MLKNGIRAFNITKAHPESSAT